MVPNPYDRHPYKKRRLGHRHTEGDHLRTQGEGGHLQAKERGSEATSPADTLISDF